MINWVERLNYALAYIDNNLCDEVDFNEISRIVACPVETVQRFFVLNTGITLTEYIRRRKLHEAFNELKSTNNKIIDIAVKYGYDSPDAFSVAFKRIYGVAPAIARNSDIDIKPFLRMIFSLNINYIQGEEIMKNVNSEEITLRATGGNWYKYFYDETYGWSWSMAYIKDSKEETSGKRFKIRINHLKFWNKWQGWEYKGEMARDFGDRVTYGIEIYTPTGTKIKTYDTVKVDVNGNIIIGGDTIFNIIGELIQAGNAEYMIGKSDGVIKDSKGNIVSDEVISAEIETYGNVDYIGNNNPWDERTENHKRWSMRQKRHAVMEKWPWGCYDDESIEGVDVTLHIKDGTKIISLCGTRSHFSNLDGIVSGETTTAGIIRLDNVGKIVLSNGIMIDAPKNTIASVEYEDGESTITIGEDSAKITQTDGREIIVPQGTVINNKGNIIK